VLVWRLGGLEIRYLVRWNERPGQTGALIINIGRRWDDRDGILKRVGFEGALHACVSVWLSICGGLIMRDQIGYIKNIISSAC
jgi:hypothetical protein